MHEIASSEPLFVLEIKSFALDVVLIANVVLLLLVQVVVCVEGIGETKVSDDDVLVAIQEQILKFEVTVHNTLLMQVSDTGHQLGEKSPRGGIFEVSMVQNIIEELASRCIFQDNAHMPLSLDKLVQSNDIRVLQFFENGDLAVDLGQASGVSRQALFADQFDRHLYSSILLPAHLYLAKLSLTQGLSKNVFSKLDLFPV